MGNLGLECDLQSCHLCDTCIYDEEIINNMEVKKFCNECQHLKKLQVRTGSITYNNLYCTNTENGVEKLIDISIPETRMVEKPKWCKLCSVSSNNKSNETHRTATKSWYSIHNEIGAVNFDEIKVGDVYHIPPFDNQRREDIVITFKGEYSASYKTLNGSTMSYAINTLWPNTLLMRMLRKHKIQVIKPIEKK